MITTRQGNEILLTDREGSGLILSNEFVHGFMVVGSERRCYRVVDLQAPGGTAEVAATVESLPHTRPYPWWALDD
jgi:hypothetical protein